jgi:hypothetical protein
MIIIQISGKKRATSLPQFRNNSKELQKRKTPDQ